VLEFEHTAPTAGIMNESQAVESPLAWNRLETVSSTRCSDPFGRDQSFSVEVDEEADFNILFGITPVAHLSRSVSFNTTFGSKAVSSTLFASDTVEPKKVTEDKDHGDNDELILGGDDDEDNRSPPSAEATTTTKGNLDMAVDDDGEIIPKTIQQVQEEQSARLDFFNTKRGEPHQSIENGFFAPDYQTPSKPRIEISPKIQLDPRAEAKKIAAAQAEANKRRSFHNAVTNKKTALGKRNYADSDSSFVQGKKSGNEIIMSQDGHLYDPKSPFLFDNSEPYQRCVFNSLFLFLFRSLFSFSFSFLCLLHFLFHFLFLSLFLFLFFTSSHHFFGSAMCRLHAEEKMGKGQPTTA
jgi:hypothetical protein